MKKYIKDITANRIINFFLSVGLGCHVTNYIIGDTMSLISFLGTTALYFIAMIQTLRSDLK